MEIISSTLRRALVLKEFFLILLPIPNTLAVCSVGSNPNMEYIKYFFLDYKIK
jgi:hypothetical protein